MVEIAEEAEMWAVPADAGAVMCMGATAGPIRTSCKEWMRRGKAGEKGEHEERRASRGEIATGEWDQVCELARATHALEEGASRGGDGVDVVPHLEGREAEGCAWRGRSRRGAAPGEREAGVMGGGGGAGARGGGGRGGDRREQ